MQILAMKRIIEDLLQTYNILLHIDIYEHSKVDVFTFDSSFKAITIFTQQSVVPVRKNCFSAMVRAINKSDEKPSRINIKTN